MAASIPPPLSTHGSVSYVAGLTPAPPTPPPAVGGTPPPDDVPPSLASLSLSEGSKARGTASPTAPSPVPGTATPHSLTLMTAACRTVSPPTPAPSPQPDHVSRDEDEWAAALRRQTELATSAAGDERQHLALLHAFVGLSSTSRLKFLSSILPHLTLPELTTLSSTISPRLRRDFLRELPIEIALHILSFVDDPKTLMRAGMVSRFWRALVSDEATWKGLCWRRGFSSATGAAPPSLKERMEEERRGRVQMYRAGVEERRRKKAAGAAMRGGASMVRTPPNQTRAVFGVGLGVVGAQARPNVPFAHGEDDGTPQPSGSRGFVGPAAFQTPEAARTALEPLSTPTQEQEPAPVPEHLPWQADDSSESGAERPEASQSLPADSAFRSVTRDVEVLSPDGTRRLLPGPVIVHAESPDPAAATPVATGEPFVSPRRGRPRSMPMLPTFSSDSAVVPPGSPSSVDLDSPPSSVDGGAPLAGFSYKSYFKRAYLTESNWLRGPGRILSTQTSHVDEVVTSIGFDDEWIVVGMASNEIHVFGADTGEYVRTLSGHQLGVWALALVSRGGERDPRDGRRKGGKDKEKGEESSGGEAQSGPARPEWTPTPSRVTSTGGVRDGQRTAGLGVAGASLSPLRTRSSNLPASSTSESSGSVSPMGANQLLPGLTPRYPATAVPPMTGQSTDPRVHGRQRRRSSFSSFMSTSRAGGAATGDGNIRAGVGGGRGGMGIGAGGDTASSAQHASACGVSRGWGQQRTLVVSGGCDRDIRVWDVLTGQCLFVLRGHSSTIRCLRVLDGRPVAVSGSRDASVRVWDIERGAAKFVLVGHSMSVRALEVSGNKIVSGSYDATSRLWDADTGECLRVFRGHYHPIYAVAFDGLRVASGSLDSTVCIWSADTGELLALLQGHTSLVGQVQINGPSDMLVTGGSDGRVIVFSLSTFECLHRICAHDNSVTCLQFDDRFIVTGGNDGRVKLWDFQTGFFIRELVEPCEAVWRVTFRDDKALILCRRGGRTVMDVLSFRPPLEELA